MQGQADQVIDWLASSAPLSRISSSAGHETVSSVGQMPMKTRELCGEAREIIYIAASYRYCGEKDKIATNDTRRVKDSGRL
jgi:hypothetical protein